MGDKTGDVKGVWTFQQILEIKGGGIYPGITTLPIPAWGMMDGVGAWLGRAGRAEECGARASVA